MSATTHRVSPRMSALAALLAISAAACSSDSLGPQVPAAIAVISGSNQIVAVEATAAEPLIVVVGDQDGLVVGGVTVAWDITEGDGTLSAASSVTDANGLAQTTFAAGSTPGTVVINASVDNLQPATFSLTVEED